ncbi:MAG TPA: glycosyltransferase family 4 protein [Chitinophagaceae bacterium]|nr:glycosyltransferase family 4 protein [Chitinophagaceae bacterium]
MKILFIHNRYRQHGGEDVAVELETSLLQQKGHEVQTIIFNNEEPSGVLNKLRFGRNAIYNKTSARLVKKTIETFRPDIVHVHNWFFAASPSVLFAASKTGVPVIMTIHNYRLVCSNALLLRNNLPCELCVQQTFPLHGIRYKCYRQSASQSALVTAITGTHKVLRTWQKKVNTYILLTAFAKSRLQGSSFRADPAKLLIKPNFIPDPGQGVQPRENFFLFAGRLSTEKGVHVLLNAFQQLAASRLIIVGEGPERDILHNSYANAANITFEGKLDRTELMELMKRCKAVIFPSLWYEGLPFTILEAYATGTPVIASRLGSMIELISDGYNGFHFSPGDVGELKHCIQTIEKAGPGIERLYTNARQTYLDHYHPDIHYQSIIPIYETTIANSRSAHV